jgi:hypothetical protein
MSTLSISLVPGALPADGDEITNAILRAIARPTIQLNGSVGTATIDDGSVTTAKMADGALSADTTGRAKMADAFVTAAKLASDSVTTAKIVDAAVTAAKMIEAARGDVHQYAAATMKSITLTSLTQTGGTATATKVAHGFTAGQTVTIAGATPSGYNVTAVIAVPTADTFTFAVSSGLSSPATGTITAINNEYVLSLSPANTVLTAGMRITFKADVACTGPVDVSVNAGGVKNLLTPALGEFKLGQIPAGALVSAVYDGTRWQAQPGPSSFTGTAAGTLAAGSTSFTHALGSKPPANKVRVTLICTTAEASWAVDDEIMADGVTRNGSSFANYSITINATTIVVRAYSAQPQVAEAANTLTALTAANWKLKVVAEL